MNEIISKHAKTALIAVLILLLLFAAHAAYKYLYYTLPPQLVSIKVRYLPDAPCRQDTPFYMQIVNDSYRDVLGTSFTLSVKVDEKSESIVQLSANAYSTDTVVKAGTTHEGCWPYPRLYKNKHDRNKLIYEVLQPNVNFGD